MFISREIPRDSSTAPLRGSARNDRVGGFSVVRHSFVILSFVIRHFFPCVCVAESAQNIPTEAAQAIAEHVPQVAIAKLQNFLSENPAAPDRAKCVRLLARAMLDAGRAREALDILRTASQENEDRLLEAEALAALGRWAEALPVFHELAAQQDAPFVEAAALGEAESLREMHRLGEAINVLQNLTQRKPNSALAQLRLAECWLDAKQFKYVQPILDSVTPQNALETKWKKYTEGRLLLAQDQAAPALVAFQDVLKEPRGLDENLLAGATIGETDARSVLTGLETADDILENFIWQHPDSTFLEEMFVRLDQIYAGEENPSESELQRLSQRPPKPRAALALFYYARALRRDDRAEKAMRAFNDFVRQFPDHPLACEAWIGLGTLCLDAGKIPAAVSAFEAAMRQSADEESRARAELAVGIAYFKEREFLLAANTFHDAAQRAGSSDRVWQQAIYNAALAWLNLGNYDRFFEDYKALSERAPEGELRRSLLLEEGLLQARSRDPRAATTLQLFVRDFPNHPRAPEAKIALAELAFFSADLDGASRYLKAANESLSQSQPDESETERAEYLAIFVADAAKDRDDEKVILLCQKFLREHANSALKPDVRMKLGQVYFRREDYANARTQFETLAAESPTNPLAETALFLAGQSAMRSMNVDRALELFDRVAKLNGPMKLYARQEQAIAETQLGKTSEAVILYDDILRSNPERALRLAALCGKADNLVATITSGADAQTDACEKAIALYDQLAADAEVTRFWRDQALYKKAKCLERISKPDAALAAFYDVLQTQTIANNEPEYFWYYKAGFDAARMLEAQEKWKAAIGIYEKMAKIAGPRADEARQRAEQLRLEHFVWE